MIRLGPGVGAEVRVEGLPDDEGRPDAVFDGRVDDAVVRVAWNEM